MLKRFVVFILLFLLYLLVVSIGTIAFIELLGFPTAEIPVYKLILTRNILAVVLVNFISPIFGLPLFMVFLAFVLTQKSKSDTLWKTYQNISIIIICVITLFVLLILPNIEIFLSLYFSIRHNIKFVYNVTSKYDDGGIYLSMFQLYINPQSFEQSIGVSKWVIAQIIFFSWFVPLWHYKLRDWFWGSKPDIEKTLI